MSQAPPARDPERIAAMFDRIVPHYDLMNRLMTVGLDRRWRAAAAAAAAPPPGRPVLDACCGTGDLSLAVARRYPDSPVTGLDFSQAMLDRARPKVARAAARVELVRGDLLALPFADATFGAVTVGWGVRNVADLEGAFAEMVRVAAPGARVVCLEATTPAGAAGRRFHAVWFSRVVPAMGALGTGDLSLAVARRYPGSPVTGLDFSDAMLGRARPKAARAGARVAFVRGDLLALPFDDATFGAVTVGWGVRNVADLECAFSEMVRVAASGARVVCLEATTPAGVAGRRFHAVWFERVVPALGALVTGDAEAYAYLPASVRSFPDAEGLAVVMRAAGLRGVRYRLFGFGAMALHVGAAPS